MVADCRWPYSFEEPPEGLCRERMWFFFFNYIGGGGG